MNKPKISIIVPIYKVENVLKRCVDSLITQSLRDIEIILVNDGSPDRCPEICNEYAIQDGRIRVIHKTNGGLSDARNVGLLNATGKYILFVDSDDYIPANACESFYSHAVLDDLDVVAADFLKENNGRRFPVVRKGVQPDIVVDGSVFLKKELKAGTMHMAACINAYRRDFLLENQLLFKIGILHEDEQWTPRVFLKARKVKYLNECLYYHVEREGSITHQPDRTKNAIDLINTVLELNGIYESLEDPELRELLYNYIVMLYLNAFYIGKLYRKAYKEYIDKAFLIKHARGLRNRSKTALFCINPVVYWATNFMLKAITRLFG